MRVREIRNRFRRVEFFRALDAKRMREGVSWRDVARETGVRVVDDATQPPPWCPLRQKDPTP